MLATDTSTYLFILETRLCPFGQPVKFETKRENPFFLRHVEQCARAEPQRGHLHHLQMARGAHARTHSRPARHVHRLKPADELEYTPEGFSSTSLALPFSPGRFRVPQMCHQTLVSIWTWGKKEILDRKVYKKRTLWIFDILCTAASKWVGWRGKEKQLQDAFLFTCCLFSLSSFREMEASARPQLTHPCIEGLSAGPWKRNRHG